jgi:hypothetical protein
MMLFEERHLIRALQNGLSGIKAVSDSFYVNEEPMMASIRSI